MTTTNDEWEDVATPAGNYVKWNNIGDSVTGWVVTYTPTSGTTDFNGDECGLLVIDDHETRELRSITLDKGALKDAVAAASPTPGLMLRVTHDRMIESKNGREYKGFRVQRNTASKAPERPASDANLEPFVVDAGEWQPYAWGQYPDRMLP